jgi:hypothetical protein
MLLHSAVRAPGVRVNTPPWFFDTVELWARRWGRHATTRWEPAVGCFVSHLTRRSNDPALKDVREGRAPESGEPIYWHEWKERARRHPISGRMVGGFVPMDIEQMGETGVTTFLDKSNMWSGRGEFKSFADAGAAQEAANQKMQDRRQKELRGALAGPLRATLRHAKGLATVSVPDTIRSEE